MNEMDVTKYDVWHYRRCLETLERHHSSCERRETCNETIKKDQCPIDCDECKFDIELWKHISIASET